MHVHQNLLGTDQKSGGVAPSAHNAGESRRCVFADLQEVGVAWTSACPPVCLRRGAGRELTGKSRAAAFAAAASLPHSACSAPPSRHA